MLWGAWVVTTAGLIGFGITAFRGEQRTALLLRDPSIAVGAGEGLDETGLAVVDVSGRTDDDRPRCHDRINPERPKRRGRFA